MKEQIKFGTDLGGVVVNRHPEGVPIYGADNYHLAPQMPLAFETLAKLAYALGQENIFIVSRAAYQFWEDQTQRWLTDNKFHEETGVLTQNVHICRERADKAGIVQKLNLTHFVDDRLEILSQLDPSINLYAFSPRESEIIQYEKELERIKIVNSWIEIQQNLPI